MMGGVNLPAWLLVLLTMLAVTRLTRLVVSDAILDGPRGWLQGRRPGGMLDYLLGCPWCVSIWIGAGAAALWVTVGDTLVYAAAAVALAASQVTGMLAPLTYPED